MVNEQLVVKLGERIAGVRFMINAFRLYKRSRCRCYAKNTGGERERRVKNGRHCFFRRVWMKDV